MATHNLVNRDRENMRAASTTRPAFLIRVHVVSPADQVFTELLVMAGYVQPNFNVRCNVWRNGNPTSAAPDLTPFGNLSPGRLTGVDVSADFSDQTTQGVMWLRLPAHTDIRDKKAPSGPDTVECPAGSGKLYGVVWVDDIGTGFANEHRFAALIGNTPWGVPFGTGVYAGGGALSNSPNHSFWGSTGGMALTTIPLNIFPQTTGSYVMCIGVFDDLNPPLINGNSVLTANAQTLTQGGHTLRIYCGGFYVSRIGATADLTFFGGAARQALWTGYLANPGLLGWQSMQGANGNLGTPNPSAGASPFQFPLRTCDVNLAEANGPAITQTNNLYSLLVRTSTYTFGGINWGMETWQQLAPLSPPSNLAPGPMLGWNGWAWITVETC